MLKGTNRSVIVVKGNGGSRFEAVYFIIKRGCSGARRELAEEAQRIIGESGFADMRGRGGREERLRFFGLGIVLGALVSSAVWLIGVLLT